MLVGRKAGKVKQYLKDIGRTSEFINKFDECIE